MFVPVYKKLSPSMASSKHLIVDALAAEAAKMNPCMVCALGSIKNTTNTNRWTRKRSVTTTTMMSQLYWKQNIAGTDNGFLPVVVLQY